MRGKSTVRLLAVLALNLFIGATAFAGGRYEDPPMNLVEVQKFSQQALEALKAGNKDAALDSVKQGRKLAVESYKEKSTMPMQVASGSLKSALNALDTGNMAEATTQVEHALSKLNEEVDYYKKEGKIK